MVYNNARRKLEKGTHWVPSEAESTTPMTRPTPGVTLRSLPACCRVSPYPCACIVLLCLLSSMAYRALPYRQCGYPDTLASQEGLRYVAADSVSGREGTRSDPIRGGDIMY